MQCRNVHGDRRGIIEDYGGSETDHFRCCGFDGIAVIVEGSAVMGLYKASFLRIIGALSWFAIGIERRVVFAVTLAA